MKYFLIRAGDIELIAVEVTNALVFIGKKNPYYVKTLQPSEGRCVYWTSDTDGEDALRHVLKKVDISFVETDNEDVAIRWIKTGVF